MHREETDQLFYHGFNGYMKHAFPEDELRPLNCSPLSRDPADPTHVEINDPLGNYSLTLVDSLSTLAILASSSGPEKKRKQAFKHFQNGVMALVELYGDGTDGPSGRGKRAHGFDLDSKVQVFETVIRGVGGLLSAHLFAVGDLPITGYNPLENMMVGDSGPRGIKWSKKFSYDGQLLRLAQDLATRLLPAFTTSTGIPYPRVNLRHGIPFYLNSPLSCEADHDPRCESAQCPTNPPGNREMAETCSAGAGTLLLEFSVLSRLTGDPLFEDLAKRAFWSIWERRSNIGLVGSNIDAETGLWANIYTGLGAGIDSFFEYAFKAYVLLSGSEVPSGNFYDVEPPLSIFYPPPLTTKHHEPESFLDVWRESHAAINRHLHRGHSFGYPHFIQSDLFTGATRALWMDALSAFYPGLLATTGDTEEAIESHVLFTALWSRYSAMPERWSMATGGIEGGLGWWLGRPEFIESTYHIFRATHDPWFLHVGEMTLKDIQRLCWAPCGLSGLQDVVTGEQNNRMESFFLGETAKYLHLLFDPDHPFNKLDSSFVFSTEGHPLVIPRHSRGIMDGETRLTKPNPARGGNDTCPIPPAMLPFSISNTAARPDLYHAANLARLDLNLRRQDLEAQGKKTGKGRNKHLVQSISPSDYIHYPWTLPLELIPHNATSSMLKQKPTFDITFPSLPNMVFPTGILQRVKQGILVSNMGGLRLGMIQDVPGIFDEASEGELFRVNSVNNVPLGRDERIFLAKDTIASVANAKDPLFTRIQDPVMLDLVVDVAIEKESNRGRGTVHLTNLPTAPPSPEIDFAEILQGSSSEASPMRDALRYLARQVSSVMKEETYVPDPTVRRWYFPAITPQGMGSAPIPNVVEAKGLDVTGNPQGSLLWRKVFVGGQNCQGMLRLSIPRDYQVIVLQRGSCSFSQKLANIPSFVPNEQSLQLVIIVSYGDDDGHDERRLTRPLLDTLQHSSSGIPRRHPVPMVMIGGGKPVYDMFRRATMLGIKRRYSVHANGIPISNLVVL